jgi:hypothetical protein
MTRLERAHFGDYNEGLDEGNGLKLVQFDQLLCEWGGRKRSDVGIGTQEMATKLGQDGTTRISAFGESNRWLGRGNRAKTGPVRRSFVWI